MRRSRKFRQGVGSVCVGDRGPYGPPSRGPIASRGFQRKPIATCDFLPTPTLPPPPPGSSHETINAHAGPRLCCSCVTLIRFLTA